MIDLTHHPDKAQGDEKKIAIFTEAKLVYERQKEAMEVLGTANMHGNAYPDRADYDRVGKVRRELFEEAFQAKYGSKMTFTDHVKAMEEDVEQKAMFKKASET